MIFLYDTSKDPSKPTRNLILIEIPPEFDDISQAVGDAIPTLRAVGTGYAKIWTLVATVPSVDWCSDSRADLHRLDRYLQPSILQFKGQYQDVVGLVPERLFNYLKSLWEEKPWPDEGKRVKLSYPASRFERGDFL